MAHCCLNQVRRSNGTSPIAMASDKPRERRVTYGHRLSGSARAARLKMRCSLRRGDGVPVCPFEGDFRVRRLQLAHIDRNLPTRPR
jgi:hypothetical protein